MGAFLFSSASLDASEYYWYFQSNNLFGRHVVARCYLTNMPTTFKGICWKLVRYVVLGLIVQEVYRTCIAPLFQMRVCAGVPWEKREVSETCLELHFLVSLLNALSWRLTRTRTNMPPPFADKMRELSRNTRRKQLLPHSPVIFHPPRINCHQNLTLRNCAFSSGEVERTHLWRELPQTLQSSSKLSFCQSCFCSVLGTKISQFQLAWWCIFFTFCTWFAILEKFVILLFMCTLLHKTRHWVLSRPVVFMNSVRTAGNTMRGYTLSVAQPKTCSKRWHWCAFSSAGVLSQYKSIDFLFLPQEGFWQRLE